MIYNYQIGVVRSKINLITLVTALLFVITTAVLQFSIANAASVSQNYTVFGETSLVSPGSSSNTALQAVSDDDPAYGGFGLEVPTGATFADINHFSADFNVTDDNCGGGSPRLAIGLDVSGTTKYVFAYFGPSPNYNTCTANTWVNTGDLLESGVTVDTGQFSGGTFYGSYDDAILNYGSYDVTKIFVVIDSAWSNSATGGDGEQTIQFDNVLVNDTLYDFEPAPTKEDCKKGGWKLMTEPGPFKNQGDCVSYFSTNGKNQPKG